MYKQIDFIQASREHVLETELKNLNEKFEKTRKSLYAKNSELLRLFLEHKVELDILKSALCRCGLEVSMADGEINFYTIKQKKAV